MNKSKQKILLNFLILYAVASLIHFVHNAEFLSDYPNLPDTWTRAGIYYAWIGATLTGLSGWLLLKYGYMIPGYLLLAIYAVLGLDSLGHYALASMSSHTLVMNLTILFEVSTAAIVFVIVLKQIALLSLHKLIKNHDA
jgi:hypothetical protein